MRFLEFEIFDIHDCFFIAIYCPLVLYNSCGHWNDATNTQFCFLSPSFLQIKVVRRGVVVVFQHGALSFQTATLLKHQSIAVKGSTTNNGCARYTKPGIRTMHFWWACNAKVGVIGRPFGCRGRWCRRRGKKHTHEASVVSRRTLQLMQLVDAKKSWCERCGLLVRATASKHQGVLSFTVHREFCSTTQQRHHHHLWWCQQPQQQPPFRAARRQEVVSESWTEAEALWCMHAGRTHR